jgi:hypothetical protein
MVDRRSGHERFERSVAGDVRRGIEQKMNAGAATKSAEGMREA